MTATATAARPLRDGDIIEIVDYDERNMPRDRLHVRRVQVRSLSRYGNQYTFTGVNLKGKYPKGYTVPVEPLAAVKYEGTYIGWLRGPSGEGDV